MPRRKWRWCILLAGLGATLLLKHLYSNSENLADSGDGHSSSYFFAPQKSQRVTSKNLSKDEIARVLASARLRAQEVWQRCSESPPPQSPLLQKAQEASKISEKLTEMFRTQYLKSQCRKLVYIPDMNFTWCLVAKVASTSWSRALLQAKYIVPEKNREQSQIRKLFSIADSSDVKHTVESSDSVLFARHPFERIVSAYRNKLSQESSSHDKEYFKRSFGNYIIARYRNITSHKYSIAPTFQEFVEYLLDTDPYRYDEHWIPTSLYCQVCETRYQFIVNYDHFQQENQAFIQYLIAKRALPSDFKVMQENYLNTDPNIVKNFMSLIPPDKIKRLIEKFYSDFTLFQFSQNQYL